MGQLYHPQLTEFHIVSKWLGQNSNPKLPSIRKHALDHCNILSPFQVPCGALGSGNTTRAYSLAGNTNAQTTSMVQHSVR